MSLSEFAKVLGIKRGIAEDALHSERVARLVLSRRTMLIGTAVATAALCSGRLFSQGGLAIPALYILAKESRTVEGVFILFGDSITMTVDPLFPDGTPVPVDKKWDFLKSYQAKYGGIFIDLPRPAKDMPAKDWAEFINQYGETRMADDDDDDNDELSDES